MRPDSTSDSEEATDRGGGDWFASLVRREGLLPALRIVQQSAVEVLRHDIGRVRALREAIFGAPRLPSPRLHGGRPSPVPDKNAYDRLFRQVIEAGDKPTDERMAQEAGMADASASQRRRRELGQGGMTMRLNATRSRPARLLAPRSSSHHPTGRNFARDPRCWPPTAAGFGDRPMRAQRRPLALREHAGTYTKGPLGVMGSPIDAPPQTWLA